MNKRAQITLKDLKTVCTETGHSPCLNAQCMYHEVCPYRNNIKPRELDLTDTPRFNKAQMALLRGLYAVGIRVIQIGGSAVQGFRKDGTTDVRFSASLIGTDTSGEKYENLDLAELLGKDGAE